MNYLYNYTISQKAILDNGFHIPRIMIDKKTGKSKKHILRLDHFALLQSIEQMIQFWQGLKTSEYKNEIYYNLSYSKIKSENPILHLKKTSMYKHLKSLEAFGLIKIRPDNKKENKTYIKLGDNNYKLHYFAIERFEESEEAGISKVEQVGVRNCKQVGVHKCEHNDVTSSYDELSNTAAKISFSGQIPTQDSMEALGTSSLDTRTELQHIPSQTQVPSIEMSKLSIEGEASEPEGAGTRTPKEKSSAKREKVGIKILENIDIDGLKNHIKSKETKLGKVPLSEVEIEIELEKIDDYLVNTKKKYVSLQAFARNWFTTTIQSRRYAQKNSNQQTRSNANNIESIYKKFEPKP